MIMNYAFLVAAHTDACQVLRLVKSLVDMGMCMYISMPSLMGT